MCLCTLTPITELCVHMDCEYSHAVLCLLPAAHALVTADVKPEPSTAASPPQAQSGLTCGDGPGLVCMFPYCTAVYGPGERDAFIAHQDDHF